jgi:hypothetical protein
MSVAEDGNALTEKGSKGMFLIFILWFTFNYKVSKTIQNVIAF